MFDFNTQNHKKFLRSNKKMAKNPPPPPLPFPPLIPKGGRKKNPKSCPKEREREGGVMEKEEYDEELCGAKRKENC